MKKNLIICILPILCCFAPAYSQLSIGVGGNLFLTKYPTYEKFRTSFNTYNQNILETPLEAFPAAIGTTFDLSYRYKFMLSYLTYNRLATSSTANYKNGLREFKLNYNFIDCGIGFGYSTDKYGLFGKMGFAFGNLWLTSYYEYSDGSIDMGLSKKMNGIFKGMPTLNGIIGVTGFVQLVPSINLFATIEYDGASKMTEMQDRHPARIDGGNSKIPQDYEKYFNNSNIAYDGDYVLCDVKGLKFSAGIKIDMTKP